MHPTDEAPRSALLTVQDVTKLLNMSTRTVYRLADEGRLPPGVKIGALRRWSRASMDAFLSQLTAR